MGNVRENIKQAVMYCNILGTWITVVEARQMKITSLLVETDWLLAVLHGLL